MDPDGVLRENIVEYIMCPNEKCRTMHTPSSIAPPERVMLGAQNRWVCTRPKKFVCGKQAFAGDAACKEPLLKPVSAETRSQDAVSTNVSR